ncbi:restriction endonuclease subunit S [Halotia wernerae UHCC 0503]|nr:restriction endonuclease subunit S [Halotia wernerae UHCC 0503]
MGHKPVDNGELASSKFQFTEQHILYGKLRPYLAKIACPEFSDICSTDILPILPRSNVDRKFLFHFLRQPKMVDYANSRAVGVNLPRLSPSVLANFEIPIPPLEEQKRIAEILDRAEELRSKRREAIAQLDTLTQAIFLEMFGDPLSNPKGWKVKTCKNICSRITVGIVVQPASYYQEYGVPALRSQNIKPNSISTDNLVFFSQSDNETKLAKTRVKAGDVVLVRTGQPGTAAVIPEELDGVNAIDLLITTPCKDVVDSVYLCSFFNSSWVKKLVLSSQVGQIQKHLNVGILNNAQIICPPLPLQQEFAHRVKSVEKLKTAHRASLSELDALFVSLQHH